LRHLGAALIGKVVESKNNSLALHIVAIKNLSILYIEKGGIK
jgi:hypothetical protein